MQVTKFYYLLWGYICPMKARIVYELEWGGGIVHMEFGKHLLRIFHREDFVLKKEKTGGFPLSPVFPCVSDWVSREI